MLSIITELLYAQEDSIIERLRNGDKRLTRDEEEKLLEFSLEVNKHMAENIITSEEVCVTADIIYFFSQEPEFTEFSARFYENVVSGIAH